MAQEPKKLTRSEIKRQQIFDAAVIEFMENGFKATSMDGISTRANVSKRTVYNHFPSKEILFEAIIERALSEDDSVASFVFDAKRDLREQLKEIALAYIEAITNEDYIKLSRVVVSEFVRDHKASRKAFAQFNVHDNAVTKFVGAAMKANLLREADPTYATTQFLSLLKAFTYTPLVMTGTPMPKKKHLDDIVGDAIEVFLKHYALDP